MRYNSSRKKWLRDESTFFIFSLFLPDSLMQINSVTFENDGDTRTEAQVLTSLLGRKLTRNDLLGIYKMKKEASLTCGMLFYILMLGKNRLKIF